jgi:phosphoribosylanthranilate isomerase
MFVKICGLRTPGDVDAALDAGADALGFVLTDSPRRLRPDEVRLLVAEVPKQILTVAVFRHEDVDTVRSASLASAVNTIQLHGPYPATVFAALRDTGAALIRVAVAHDRRGDPSELTCGNFGEDMLLVDAPQPGAGETWDWNSVKETPPTGKWILAGGLNADNVAEAIAALRPWGVDISSGVESRRGVKDPRLIKRFVEAVRAAEVEYQHR